MKLRLKNSEEHSAEFGRIGAQIADLQIRIGPSGQTKERTYTAEEYQMFVRNCTQVLQDIYNAAKAVSSDMEEIPEGGRHDG